MDATPEKRAKMGQVTRRTLLTMLCYQGGEGIDTPIQSDACHSPTFFTERSEIEVKGGGVQDGHGGFGLFACTLALKFGAEATAGRLLRPKKKLDPYRGGEGSWGVLGYCWPTACRLTAVGLQLMAVGL